MMDQINKVTHLCYAAAHQTAAFRLHKSLVSLKCRSKIITGAKSVIDKDLIQPQTTKERVSALTGVLRERFYKTIFYNKCTTYFSLNFGPTLLQKIWLKKMYKTKSEIIHLHWIGNGFIPLRAISFFKKPIVWTMHDLWPVTGGCHVIGSCNKFETHCGACPQIKSKRKNDLTSKHFARKKQIYKKLNLTIVVPSLWMENEAKKSPLLNNIKIYRIPNALDTDVFKPLSKKFTREALNLNQNRKIIAFGAISGMSDPNKGFDLLIEAIKIVTNQRKDLLLLIFGGTNTSTAENNFGCESKHIGRLSDDLTLAMVYSAADVVVVPSRQESFSQVSSESVACGTPVVAFNSTGPRDIVNHKENGYLAKPYDFKDLAKGILWILDDDKRWLTLSKKARMKALNFFSYKAVGQQHIDLYNKIIEENENC